MVNYFINLDHKLNVVANEIFITGGGAYKFQNYLEVKFFTIELLNYFF